MYWVYKNVIDGGQAARFISEADWRAKKDATVYTAGGTEVNRKTRTTKVLFLPPLSLVGCLLSEYIRDANVAAGWNFNINSLETVQMAEYVKGGHYIEHTDCPTDGGIQATSRKLTATLMLTSTKEYEGGNLHFAYGDKPDKPFELGDLVVFPAYCKHLVTPVKSGKRHTATGWMLGPAFV